MPERFAGGRIERHEVARDIAAEEQSSGRGEQARTSAPVPDSGAESVLPDGLACLVVDRREIAAAASDADFFLAAETHRATRIELGEVIHCVVLGSGNVEETGVRAERRRRPVRGAAIGRRDECAADVMILRGIANRLALAVETLRPV